MVPQVSRGRLGGGAGYGLCLALTQEYRFQRQASKADCVHVASFVPAQGRKASLYPSCPRMAAQSPRDIPCPSLLPACGFGVGLNGSLVLSEQGWQGQLEPSCSVSPKAGRSGVKGVCAEAGVRIGKDSQEVHSHERGSPVAECREG